MIKGRDFLVLADDWNGAPSSTVHLFRQLSRHNRVFWLKLISRMPQWKWGDLRRAGRTVSAWLKRTQQTSPPEAAGCNGHGVPQVWPGTAVMFPWFNRFGRRLNRASLYRQCRRLMQRHGIEAPVVVTTLPPAVDLLRQMTAGPKIYYCLDDWSHYPGLDHAAYASMERELIELVDGFAATSRRLMEKSPGGPCRLYLPQGVDFEHFYGARCEPQVVPDMEKIRKPIVGFFGLIAEWVDVRMLAAASRRFPDVSFVIIGQSRLPIGDLVARPNVHFLGPRDYAELPRFARYFDVGIIPFVQDELTAAVNPLKLLEYFALGLPVVASGLPELRNMAGPVFMASDAEEFCCQLETVLKQPRAYSDAAVAVSRANTWESRAESFSRFLAQLPSSGTRRCPPTNV